MDGERGVNRWRVVFIGGARYSQPLDSTSRKKFERLSKLGDIRVVGFSQDMRYRHFTEHARFYLLPQLPSPILRYITMFLGGSTLLFWLVLRHHAEIIVAQSPYEGFPAAVIKIVARAARKKIALVVENHGDFEKSLFLQRTVRFSGLYRFIMRRIALFSIRRADVLRAVSEATRRQLQQYAPHTPVVKFPAWTDIDVFLRAGNVLHPEDTPVFLYAGALIPGKGVHILLDAFSKVIREFPRVQLVIAGRADNPEYARALQELIRKRNIASQVRFLGELPQPELARWMGQATALILPSLSEGLGRVVFEAMAAGTPVIGSRIGGIPDMIQDGVTGFLVPPGDVNALAERLRWMLRNPERVCEIGKKAREFARSFFSPDGYVQHYENLFRRAAQAPKTLTME